MAVGALAIASLFLTGASIIQQRKAGRRQRAANDLQQRIQEIKSKRERTRLLAEARRKSALLATQAQFSGASGSSGAIAGQSGVTSQAASGVSFLDQVQQLSSQSNIFAQQSADALSTAKLFQAGAGLAKNANGLFPSTSTGES